MKKAKRKPQTGPVIKKAQQAMATKNKRERKKEREREREREKERGNKIGQVMVRMMNEV